MIANFGGFYKLSWQNDFIWYEDTVSTNYGHHRQAEIALARLFALRKLGVQTNSCKLSENL